MSVATETQDGAFLVLNDSGRLDGVVEALQALQYTVHSPQNPDEITELTRNNFYSAAILDPNSDSVTPEMLEPVKTETKVLLYGPTMGKVLGKKGIDASAVDMHTDQSAETEETYGQTVVDQLEGWYNGFAPYGKKLAAFGIEGIVHPHRDFQIGKAKVKTGQTGARFLDFHNGISINLTKGSSEIVPLAEVLCYFLNNLTKPILKNELDQQLERNTTGSLNTFVSKIEDVSNFTLKRGNFKYALYIKR